MDSSKTVSSIDNTENAVSGTERQFVEEIETIGKEHNMKFKTRYEWIRYQDGMKDGEIKGKKEAKAGAEMDQKSNISIVLHVGKPCGDETSDAGSIPRHEHPAD